MGPRLIFNKDKKSEQGALQIQSMLKHKSSPLRIEATADNLLKTKMVSETKETPNTPLVEAREDSKGSLLSPIYGSAQQKSSLKKRNLFDSSSAEKRRTSRPFSRVMGLTPVSACCHLAPVSS